MITPDTSPLIANIELWRIGGASAGALVAFLVLWPVGKREFLARLIVSLICGYVFAPVLRDYMDWMEFPRLVFAAAMTCAGASWFVIGAGVRILKGMDKLPKI